MSGIDDINECVGFSIERLYRKYKDRTDKRKKAAVPGGKTEYKQKK